MGHLFISYTADDSALARAIAQGLEAAGYATWYYERDSLPGASYLSQILDGLAAATAVLVLLSPAALASHQIDKEVIQAHEAGRPFVPLLHGLTHEALRQRRPEWAMAMGASVSVPVPPEGAAALLPRLLEGLRRLVGPPAAAGQLQAEPSPASTAAARRDNLPAEVTSFVGRAQEQDAVLTLLERARLVTLRGPGGVGKTRLALQAAAAARASYPDGVWLVELAPLAESGVVAAAVAQTLEVREEAGRSPLDALAAALRERRLLLLLDNCEHLIAACAGLAATLLRACPELRILATSREGLGVVGEQLYDVPPLPAPDPARLPPVAELSQVEAVRLFVERVQARKPDFQLTAANAPAVAAICHRLDGIPLAIELAAARVGVLPVEGIAARLDDRFRLLTGGPRTALPRQQTLRAALDWSYELLTLSEQALLRRAAVFAGGCTLGAATVVGAGQGVEEWETLDLVTGLVNKSLLGLTESDDEARYTLLETVRQYAWARLAEAGEERAARARHLAWALALAEEAAPHLGEPGQAAWLRRLETEHDNLRAALERARETDAAGAAGPAEGSRWVELRLAAALWQFWYTHGHLAEGCERLEAALTRSGGAPAALRARALYGASSLVDRRGDHARAASLAQESLGLARAEGDERAIGNALNMLGNVAADRGYAEEAGKHYEESLALRRRLGDTRGIIATLNNLGELAREQDDHTQAARLFEESVDMAETAGYRWSQAIASLNLGLTVYALGDYARAERLYGESMAIFEELGDRWHIAAALANRAQVAQARGDNDMAASLYERSAALFEAVGDSVTAHEVRQDLADMATKRSDAG